VDMRYGTYSCYFCYDCRTVCEIDISRQPLYCKSCGSNRILPPENLSDEPCPVCKNSLLKNTAVGIA
jgi:hypothetical protein